MAGKGSGAFNAESTEGRTAHEINNGNGITGDLHVLSTGAYNWDGDNGGTDVDDTWWFPLNTVVGTWHARLEFVSGTNFFLQSAYDPINTWIAVSTEIRWHFYENGYGSGGGSQQGVYNVKWSKDAGSTTHHTQTLTITMQEDSL